jgi:hypothetical protein
MTVLFVVLALNGGAVVAVKGNGGVTSGPPLLTRLSNP